MAEFELLSRVTVRVKTDSQKVLLTTSHLREVAKRIVRNGIQGKTGGHERTQLSLQFPGTLQLSSSVRQYYKANCLCIIAYHISNLR